MPRTVGFVSFFFIFLSKPYSKCTRAGLTRQELNVATAIRCPARLTAVNGLYNFLPSAGTFIPETSRSAAWIGLLYEETDDKKIHKNNL